MDIVLQLLRFASREKCFAVLHRTQAFNSAGMHQEMKTEEGKNFSQY